MPNPTLCCSVCCVPRTTWRPRRSLTAFLNSGSPTSANTAMCTSTTPSSLTVHPCCLWMLLEWRCCWKWVGWRVHTALNACMRVCMCVCMCDWCTCMHARKLHCCAVPLRACMQGPLQHTLSKALFSVCIRTWHFVACVLRPPSIAHGQDTFYVYQGMHLLS